MKQQYSLIRSFIASLQIRSELKDMLAAEKLLEKHSFYLQLSHFLSPVFPTIPEKVFRNLTGYSYLYFRFTLLVDQLLDKPLTGAAHSEQVFACTAVHEQAVRGLTQLFPDDDTFWVDFEQCKKEYVVANTREKEISAAHAGFSESLFEQIASGKSAICYAMAHAMYKLNNSAGPVEEVQLCLQHLHIALQYLDDIQDFKQDWQDGQYTYAHFLVESYLRDNQIAGSQLSGTELYQHCYTSGVVQYLLSRCSHHFRLSIGIAHSLGLPDLAAYVQMQLDGCNIYQHEVAQLLEKTRVKACKSFVPLHTEPLGLELPTMQRAVMAALRHLQTSRDANGCWLDFLTSAGQSKMWTTAYAGLLLAETKAGLTTAHEAFDASFLLPLSYNEGIMQDGDSTNFSMGLRRKVWGETSPVQISAWLEFMNADGGWVTYRDETRLRKIMKLPTHVSVAAWLTPKLCVTAAAAYVLKLYPELRPQYEASCGYLAHRQHPDGYWPSYWWTSPIYATAFAVLALAPLPQHEQCREAGLRWLAAQQASNGAWYGDTNANQPSAFFTALVLKALLEHSSHDYSAVAERGARWLLNQQMSDGSWLTTRILRVPGTNVENPAAVKRWRLSSFGTDIEVDDHNRVFTTSTALNALSLYAKTLVTLPAYA